MFLAVHAFRAKSNPDSKQQSLSSVSAVLGPTTVLRQRPFSFVKELNNWTQSIGFIYIGINLDIDAIHWTGVIILE